MKKAGWVKLVFWSTVSGLLSAQTTPSLPPIYRSGSQLIFSGTGQDWPARLLEMDRGKVSLKRTLGYPTVQGTFSGPAVFWHDRLQVFDWARVDGPKGREVVWQLHERGLEAKDGWKVVREGRLQPNVRIRALLPLEDSDCYLLVGWLHHLEGPARNLPVHRVRINAKGEMEVLESLGSDKEDLVKALQIKRSAMADLVIHAGPEGQWMVLYPYAGMLWAVDEKGHHRHSLTLSAHVTPEALRQNRAPMQVVIQSQPTEDGMLWIQARNEDCLEAASYQESRRSTAPPSPFPAPAGQGVPPITTLESNEPWRQEIDQVIRRHPRLRWIEYNPRTRTAKDMATAPAGGADVAMSFGELMSASRWIPGDLGQVIPIPDALMPWATAPDLKKEEGPKLPSSETKMAAPPAPPTATADTRGKSVKVASPAPVKPASEIDKVPGRS